MTNRANSIEFLEHYPLFKQVFELNSEGTPNSDLSKLQILEATDMPRDQINTHFHENSYYRALAGEYEHFRDDRYIENIHLVINGVDGKTFASATTRAEKDDYIKIARHRLETQLFNTRVDVYPDDVYIDALWFLPRPLNLEKFSLEGLQKIKQNISCYLSEKLGLMVREVSPSYAGDGLEEWFFDHHFQMNQLLQIMGLSEQVSFIQPHSNIEQSNEETIFSYFSRNSLDMLKAAVKKEIRAPFDFDVDSPMELNNASDGCFFMPFFEVHLNIRSDDLVEQIIKRIDKRFEVTDQIEIDGQLVLRCFAHEGPYADTAFDIVTNINELLGPYIMEAFNDMGLEVSKFQFLLSVCYR